MFNVERVRLMAPKDKKQKKVIAIQNVEPELWDSVIDFLQTYRRIPSISKLAGAALENYIRLAKKYGIDEDWKLKIPKDGDKE
jgi:hypothetical protein